MFEWITDPTAWIGLTTLIALEIVLGIDNLLFISIVVEKLPPHQRDRARVIGLSLALLMRLGLLASISWLAGLTSPLFTVLAVELSGRDLILLGGGLFLLFKATTEIHERLEGQAHHGGATKAYAPFGVVVAQIVVLDAVFSLDSVITAVGMVDELAVMMIAVIVAIGVMLLASKPLATFVSRHPTVVMLCLGFLLMIGFSLVAEGLGYHVPKGYLYAAIGFSVLIEAFNQMARTSRLKAANASPARQRTADAVLRLLGGRAEQAADDPMVVSEGLGGPEPLVFTDSERDMVRGVFSLAELPVSMIMTPAPDIAWIDLDDPSEKILAAILATEFSRLIVARGSIDRVAGVLRRKDLVGLPPERIAAELPQLLRPPLIIAEHAPVLTALEQFKSGPAHVALVVNEFGAVEGMLTRSDILEAIAGDLPEPHEKETVRRDDGSVQLHGLLSIREAAATLGWHDVPKGPFATLAGFLISQLGRIPQQGETLIWDGWTLEAAQLDGHRVASVRAVPAGPPGGVPASG